MKLRLLSAAALTAFMVAAAPAMTSQAAVFTTCVSVNNSGVIFNSGMFSGNLGQNGQGSCGNFQMGGNCQTGSGLLPGGSCRNGNDCLTGGSCQGGNGCLTGGSCQNGNDCLSGQSCQGENLWNGGAQDGAQTLPSFGGMPVSFMPVSF